MIIKIDIEQVYEDFENKTELEQMEIIAALIGIVKPENKTNFLDEITTAAAITESQFKEAGRELFGLYETGPERDTAANTNYKY